MPLLRDMKRSEVPVSVDERLGGAGRAGGRRSKRKEEQLKGGVVGRRSRRKEEQ